MLKKIRISLPISFFKKYNLITRTIFPSVRFLRSITLIIKQWKKKTTKKIDLISHSLKFRERERHTHTHTHEKYGWTRARAPVKADDPLHRIVRQGDRKRPTSETAYNFLCKAGARSFHLENCNLLRRWGSVRREDTRGFERVLDANDRNLPPETDSIITSSERPPFLFSSVHRAAILEYPGR